MSRVFDRLHSVKDKRDADYPIRVKRSARVYRYWNDGRFFLDQEDKPFCVGYAAAHWLVSRPQSTLILPEGLYYAAQFYDEWPGEEYEGTSVRGVAKTLQSLGFLKEYRWATSLNQAVSAILNNGPLIIGVNWYDGMMDTDSKGLLHVSGEVVGGHAVLVRGVNKSTKLFEIKNSWGKAWGNNGRARISFDDMQRLIEEEGEVVLGTKTKPDDFYKKAKRSKYAKS